MNIIREIIDNFGRKTKTIKINWITAKKDLKWKIH